jgi:putative transposase
MSRRKEPMIPNELLDQLLAGGAASAAFEQGGLLDSLKKALTERALNAEMDHHLAGDDGAGNTRNGYGGKTVTTDTSKLEIDVPRDRQSSFDPQLIAKYQRRFPGFDDKIVSMYARGMSTREITGHLHELYGIDVSPDLISTVTDAVLDEVATWQQRPLYPIYPLVFFDAIRVKIRDEGMVRNKAIHIALGVRADGAKEVLGLWLEQNEGAKFWLRVMNELRNRGTEDILLAVVDGLKGFPEAINAVFPEAIVQTCIVHPQELDGLRLLEGSQGPGDGAQGNLPSAERRSGRKGADGVRGWPVRPALSRHRSKLAARLSRGHPVLRLSRRGAQDRLYDECHRGFELEAQARRPGQGPLPQRRCRHQAALSDLEPVRERVENAAA